MLIYKTIDQIEIPLDSFSQELRINRSTGKLLENDKSLISSIDILNEGDLKKLRIANRKEVMRLKETQKALCPAYVLSLSATPKDIHYNRNDRFITNITYRKSVDSYNPSTVFIDLSFDKNFIGKHFPSNASIIAKAEEFLNGYEPRDGVILYVRFVWIRHWIKKKRKTWHVHHHHYHYYEDHLYQDTYKRQNGNWILKRRKESLRI